jgi:hypothetical protein
VQAKQQPQQVDASCHLIKCSAVTTQTLAHVCATQVARRLHAFLSCYESERVYAETLMCTCIDAYKGSSAANRCSMTLSLTPRTSAGLQCSHTLAQWCLLPALITGLTGICVVDSFETQQPPACAQSHTQRGQCKGLPDTHIAKAKTQQAPANQTLYDGFVHTAQHQQQDGAGVESALPQRSSSRPCRSADLTRPKGPRKGMAGQLWSTLVNGDQAKQNTSLK